MKIDFSNQSKNEMAARFNDDVSAMSAAVRKLFEEMHEFASEEGYYQYTAAYEKFRQIHAEEMRAGITKTFQLWKQSDASFASLLKEMKAVEQDRIKSLAAEFEAPLEEALRNALKYEPAMLKEDDTVHQSRSVEESSALLQEMLDDCFDQLERQLYDAGPAYSSLSYDNQLYACVGALVESILSIAANLYNLFADAAEKLGIHLNERADSAAAKASDASAMLQKNSETFISRLDHLIGLFGD